MSHTIPEQIMSIGDIEGFYDALASIRKTRKVATCTISSGIVMINGAMATYHSAYLTVHATAEEYNNWREAEKLKKVKQGNTSTLARA